MNMEVYFDNSATTRCYDSVKDIVIRTMTEDFGNPSAMHLKGVEAEKYVKDSAARLARILKVQEKEILFTSGGTESDNLALIGAAMANKRSGNHIITTAVEHPAVSQPALFLQEQGFEVTYLPVDSRGVVKLDALEAVLRPDTILVSVMYVNNEVGAVMPVEEIGRRIREKSPKALFHVDAIQAFGKYRIYPKKMGIDLLSVSSHKIHGPKGVGFLYINEKAKIQPQILGGGQQSGMRSGTDNVPGIAGLGVAAEEIYRNLDANVEKMYCLKEHIAKGLTKIPDIRINGMELREGAPQILSISVMGVRSEVLLHSLEERGIFISAGSACSSHKRKPSSTLAAMGMPKDQIESTVRLSFSEENTVEEADYFLQVMEEMVPMLRRYSRR
ncbi:cysteine desulfurase family protein [Blautia glucerasea]